MYRNILAPIDCTDEARRAADGLARFVGPLHGTKVTLAATISPSTDAATRGKKVRHARGALSAIGDVLLQYGVFARHRIVEGVDAAQALAEEGADRMVQYDLILLGTHQTRVEIDAGPDGAPRFGSLADRIARRATVPVLVLPDTGATYAQEVGSI